MEKKKSRALLTEFTPPTDAEWREAVDKLLKGKSYDRIMLTRTYEGIQLQPMYRRQAIEGNPEDMPGFFPYTRSVHKSGYTIHSWEVAQEISDPTCDEFNTSLLRHLERGQTAINLILDQAGSYGLDPDHAQVGQVGAEGVSIASIADLSKAFAHIDLEKFPIYIHPGLSALPIAAMLVALAKRRGLDLKKLRGAIAFDPLGVLAADGSPRISLDSEYQKMASLVLWFADRCPQIRAIGVDGQIYHNGGGSATQELAFAVATGTEYLREMIKRNVPIDSAANSVRFTFSLGSNFFMEIAKLRAARMIWAQIVKAFGGSDHAQKMAIHGRTSKWNKSKLDPYVNMLRSTTEALSGIFGGCDSLHVSPFDETIRQPDEFSRRIALNTQSILKEESHFSFIIDPAGGSWYVEKLTDQLSNAAWRLFQRIEQEGGMFQALQQGFPQQETAQIQEERLKNLAKRKDIMVGSNMYPNIEEKPLESRKPDYDAIYRERSEHLKRLRASDGYADQVETLREFPDSFDKIVHAAGQGVTLGEIARLFPGHDKNQPTITPVTQGHASEMFESLRQAMDEYSDEIGYRPTVFLATMGPASQHRARADFSAGFFRIAGFDIIDNVGFETPDHAATAAIRSKAVIVAICSTDSTYLDIVPDIAEKVKAARPGTAIVVAGRPKDQTGALKEAGVDGFVYLGANVYESLVCFMKKIGVKLSD